MTDDAFTTVRARDSTVGRTFPFDGKECQVTAVRIGRNPDVREVDLLAVVGSDTVTTEYDANVKILCVRVDPGGANPALLVKLIDDSRADGWSEDAILGMIHQRVKDKITQEKLIEAYHAVFDVKDAQVPGSGLFERAAYVARGIANLIEDLGGTAPSRFDGEGRQ